MFPWPVSVTEPYLTAREDRQYGLCVQEEKEMGFVEYKNEYLSQHSTQSFTAKISSYIKEHNIHTSEL